MSTEFETDLKLLRDNFQAQLFTMRAYGAENDTLLNALAYAGSTYALVENHILLTYQNLISYWPDWTNKLTDLFTAYCADAYATIKSNPHLEPLIANLKKASVTFDELQRIGRSVGDQQREYRLRMKNVVSNEVPAA